MISPTYIHYGHPEYDPTAIITNKGTPVRSKPKTGLWASRKDAPYGWIDWCRSQAVGDEEFGFGNFDCSFEFQLDPCAHILEIHSEKDILPYVLKEDNYRAFLSCEGTSTGDGIDFNKIMSDGYDGIELFISDDPRMRDGVFCYWDCDSIVIWNPDIIKVKED